MLAKPTWEAVYPNHKGEADRQHKKIKVRSGGNRHSSSLLERNHCHGRRRHTVYREVPGDLIFIMLQPVTHCFLMARSRHFQSSVVNLSGIPQRQRLPYTRSSGKCFWNLLPSHPVPDVFIKKRAAFSSQRSYTFCVTLNKFLNLSEARFPYLQNRTNNGAFLTESLSRLNEIIHMECFLWGYRKAHDMH